ncbi:NAD(P) transhydrogenase subunit alpha [Devosia pacifica]|uniref:NAD(P) transhydrogenase subunit alpha n=1 Tax=Devosia pacifica TaxID=1335967 RepID=A0A918SER3_9HYPH|nr:Re/Si-specific NAD(P)(+) transhydrogenase subunit alpha [Devosia pacifica]GHA38192.1 NAD(P) transhydrogenase subunit alpha [Devosia pacifica]
MKIAILRERAEGETRVAATPETAGKLSALGFEIAIEAGAGAASRYPDSAYEAAGASIGRDARTTLANAEVVLCVRRPAPSQLRSVRSGALLIGALDPFGNEGEIAAIARAGVVAFSLELLPRITRAQTMDILSSQANLAGYQSVIEATSVFGRAMPMMMTAAGTVRPAKVFVMGAGVAGLQAIATARRLGAVVSATDVRPAAKEQVESLGAKFIAVEDDEFRQAETAGGYAKEMSAEYRDKQAELTAQHIAKQDIVITTALIPGRAAPRLIDRDVVESMSEGSVIVDLAAERGGNVEMTKPGAMIEHNGVKIIGFTNMQGRIPATASQLYARNLIAFLEPMLDKAERELKLDWDDELIKATLITREGAIVHPGIAAAAEAHAHVDEDKTVATPADEPVKAGATGRIATKPASAATKPKSGARAKRAPAKTGAASKSGTGKSATTRARKPAGAAAGKSRKATDKPGSKASQPADTTPDAPEKGE